MILNYYDKYSKNDCVSRKQNILIYINKYDSLPFPRNITGIINLPASPFGCNLSAFTSLLMPDGSFTGQAEPVVNIITAIFISFSDELFARLLFAGKAMPVIISM